MSWGPQHQQAPKTSSGTGCGWLTIILSVWVAVALVISGSHPVISDLMVYALIALALFRIIVWIRRRLDRHPGWRVTRLAARVWPRRRASQHAVIDPATVLPDQAGVYLGLDAKHDTWRTDPERAVLVLGPPRSGKTSAIITPTLLSYAGPAVSTSTKPDVMRATASVRSRVGRVWQFDPTGTSQPTPGVETLRWSPVTAATSWDGALLMARAMVSGAHVGTGTTDQTHWTRRAQALLAPLLHAAAVSGKSVGDVVDWVARHEVDEPGALLTEHDSAKLAVGQLVGLQNTEARERSSIFSAAADALDAYSSQAALDAAEEPNFFPGRFVTSQDTIYIHAPAEHQALAAPLVCGLLAEIRRATYQHHRDHTLPRPVLFALDEVANVAPIQELPQIASEGGSQGIVLLAALQDLSQARARWGDQADGFLTLFGVKLLLGGIGDHKTLEAVSSSLGEYDRRMVSRSHPDRSFWDAVPGNRQPIQRGSTTYSTQRQRRLSPGDIARLPHGQGLVLHDGTYRLITLTPAHTTQPWQSLIDGSPR